MVVVHGRGSGRAIVRDARGRYLGRVTRIGTTGWQTWRVQRDAPHLFVGWARTRRDAVARLDRSR